MPALDVDKGGEMRVLIASLTLLLLVACAQSSGPASNEPSDWRQYGKEEALVGYVKQTKQELAAAATVSVTNEIYSAYSDGYEQGRAEYCKQDPKILGKKGELYRGICDELRPTFRTWYNNGKASRGRSLY